MRWKFAKAGRLSGAFAVILLSTLPMRAAAQLPTLPYPKAAAFVGEKKVLTVAWSNGVVTQESSEGRRVLLRESLKVDDIQLSADGRRVLIRSARMIRVLEIGSGRTLLTHALPHEPYATFLLSPDGEQLVVSYEKEQRSELFDLTRGTSLGASEGTFEDGGFYGRYLLLVLDQSRDGPGDTLIVLDRDGKQLSRRLFPAIFASAPLQAEADTMLLVDHRRLYLLDIARNVIVQSYPIARVPTQLLARADGSVASHRDHAWEVRDPATGTRRGLVGYTPDQRDITGMTAGPDGRLLLWVGDQTLMLADPASASTRALFDFGEDSQWLAASSDGEHVAIGADRSLRIVDLSRARPSERCIEPPGGAHRCAIADLRRTMGKVEAAEADDLRTLVALLQRQEMARWDSERADGYDYLAAARRLVELDLDDEAEAAYRWALGFSNPHMLPGTTLAFGELLLRQRRFAEARAMLAPLAAQQSALYRNEKYPPKILSHIFAVLSEAQLETQQVEAAIVSAQRSYELYGSTASFSGRYVGRAMLVKARALTLLGRLAEAQALRVDLLKQLSRNYGETPLAVETRISLGEGYALQGNVAQGDALIVDAIEIIKRSFGDANPTMIDARERLGRLRLRAGQSSQALTPVRAATAALSGAQQVRLDRFRSLFRLHVATAWMARQSRASATTDPKVTKAPSVADAGHPTIARHEGELTAVALSPDGRFAVTGSRDRTLRVWDARSGVQLRMTSVSGWVDSVQFIAPTVVLVRAYRAFTIDVVTGETRTLGLDDITHGVAHAGDGTIAVGHDVGVLILRADEQRVSIPGDDIRDITLSPDGKRLAGRLQESNEVILWDAVNGQRIGSMGKSDTAPVFLGSLVIVIAPGLPGSDIVQRYDAVTGKLVGPVASEDCFLHNIRAAAGQMFAPGRTSCLLGPGDQQMRPFFKGSDYVHRAALAPDGRLAALALEGGRILVIEVATGRVLHTLLHGNKVTGLAFCENGQFLLSGADELVGRVWDTRSGQALVQLGD